MLPRPGVALSLKGTLVDRCHQLEDQQRTKERGRSFWDQLQDHQGSISKLQARDKTQVSWAWNPREEKAIRSLTFSSERNKEPMERKQILHQDSAVEQNLQDSSKRISQGRHHWTIWRPVSTCDERNTASKPVRAEFGQRRFRRKDQGSEQQRKANYNKTETERESAGLVLETALTRGRDRNHWRLSASLWETELRASSECWLESRKSHCSGKLGQKSSVGLRTPRANGEVPCDLLESFAWKLIVCKHLQICCFFVILHAVSRIGQAFLSKVRIQRQFKMHSHWIKMRSSRAAAQTVLL